MPSLVERLIVGEVSLVDEAANLRDLLVLKKLGANTVSPTDKLVKLALDTELENEGAVTEKLEGVSEDGQAAVLAALRILHAHGEEVNSEIMKSLAADFGIAVEAPPKVDKKEEVPPVEDEDKTIEGLPEEVRELITKQKDSYEALQKRLDKAESRADALERASKREEFILKAKELGLPGADSEDLGDTLLSIDEKSPETYKKLVGVLESTANVLRESKLFKSIGTDAPGSPSDNAWDKIQKRAEAKVEESNGKLNLSKATDLVMREDPDLALQYQKENR